MRTPRPAGARSPSPHATARLPPEQRARPEQHDLSERGNENAPHAERVPGAGADASEWQSGTAMRFRNRLLGLWQLTTAAPNILRSSGEPGAHSAMR